MHLYGQAADMTAIDADRRAAQPRRRRGRVPGAPGDVRREAGRHDRRGRRVQLLSDEESRRARRWRRRDVKDAALAARARRIRNGGQSDRYHHEEFGVNSRLDEMQAAVLRARLQFLPGWTARRRALAARYRLLLADAPCDHRSAGARRRPRLSSLPRSQRQRSEIQRRLHLEGIETLVHYPVPITLQPALASERPDDCPVADRVCARVFSLPLYPSIADEALARVARALS